MKNIIRASVVLLLLSAFGWAADDVVSAVHGTVTKVDASTKTVVVKSKDGTEHTFKFVDKTTVHGVKSAAMQQRRWGPKTASTESRKVRTWSSTTP